jgi:hypothetical protein
MSDFRLVLMLALERVQSYIEVPHDRPLRIGIG